MEKDETLDSLNFGVFRSQREMLEPDHFPDLIEQSALGVGNDESPDTAFRLCFFHI